MVRDDTRRTRARDIAALERHILQYLVEAPTWLARHDESALRWAMSLARVTSVVVRAQEGEAGTCDIGRATDGYRDALYRILAPCVDENGRVHRDALRSQIAKVRDLARDERQTLLHLFGGRMPAAALDRAVRTRPLALALAGGGGTAYVYLGAFAVLEDAGLVPSAISGTSMGGILGAFRARRRGFSLTEVKSLVNRLAWRRLLRVSRTGNRFGVPATFRLFLREVIGHEFESDGRFMTMADLEIPFSVAVAGLPHKDGAAPNWDRYEHLLDDAVQDVRRVRRMATSIARAVVELTRQPLKNIVIGQDELTHDFDVLDAVGFSSAVPGVVHYDILRDDPRMVSLVESLMAREGVVRFIDGGLANNLPGRAAFEAVQNGDGAGRDPFVLCLDAFAPNFRRHLLFTPLARMAQETSKDGRRVADLTITYDNVLSPLTVVPTPEEFLRAIANGKAETAPFIPLIRKAVGPIPDPEGIVTAMDGTGRRPWRGGR